MIDAVLAQLRIWLGAGVLPDHIAAQLIKNGHKLHIYEGKGQPLSNEIRSIRLKRHELSRTAQKVYEELEKVF